jgi:hypothetical protein
VYFLVCSRVDRRKVHALVQYFHFVYYPRVRQKDKKTDSLSVLQTGPRDRQKDKKTDSLSVLGSGFRVLPDP